MQTSFIPKRPLVENAAPMRSHVGILWFIVLILFIASLLAAGGAFVFQQYLQNSIRTQSDSLARAQAAYDPAVINNIIRLDSRIIQTKALLQNHIAPSSIFAFLGNITLQNVRFSDFSYSINPNGSAALTLNGEALDFASVALQSDAFSQNRNLKDVLFSDINIDGGTGHIVFNVSAIVDSSLLLYRNSYASSGGAAPVSSSGAPTSGQSVAATSSASVPQ